ncbi:hypothetical protein DL98DRAFT_526039 [Cadophora sp. DSE1049]|nr:hypothetical protein DL98DRAFT_526039 [Cadophora sp. DSE1049]
MQRDHTKQGGYGHIRRHLTDEHIREYLLSGDKWRVRVINVWRPLSGAVGDVPLAFGDCGTINSEDLIPTDRPWRGLNREIYNIRWNPKQRWYWIRDQTPEEATLFVNWDSPPMPGGAEFCAHAAFLDPNGDKTRPPRRSVEVRALVITERCV